MVIGTILLCLGMALCAYLIESKTKEHVFEKKVSPNAKATIKSRFYWVQPGNQTIGDQMFDPFGYSDTKFPLLKYITSYKDKKGNVTMGYIWTAVSLSTIGFICQFLGLRACHSSVSVLQLGVTIIMSIIRAGLRAQRLREEDNGMAGDPNFFQGHELDWLAIKIGQSDMPSKPNTCKWRIISTQRTSCADTTISTAVNVSSYSEAQGKNISCVLEILQGVSGGLPILSGFRIQSYESNPAESVMKVAEKEIARWISAEYCTGKTQHYCTLDSCELGPNTTVKTCFYRSRLARMTGLEEPESEHSSHWGKRHILVRDTAIALAQAIEETMQVLFASDSQQSVKLSGSWGQTFRLFWAIQSSYSLEDETIQMSLRREINKDRLPEGPWKAEASEIEAVLGLWFWSLKEKEPRDSQDAEDVGSKKFDKRISRILSTSRIKKNISGEILDLYIWGGEREVKIQDCRLKVQDADTQPGSGNVSEAEGDEHQTNQSSSPGRNINRAEVENGVWWKDGYKFVVGVGENRPPSESDNQRRFFGWCNMKDTSLYDDFNALVMTSKSSLLLNCAQEIYSSFLSAIMTAVQDIGKIEARRHQDGIKVNNETVDKIRGILIKRGLCDEEDAFACTIPILRNQHKLQLPDRILDEILEWTENSAKKSLLGNKGKVFREFIDCRLDRSYSSLGSISGQESSFERLEAINQVRRTVIGACEIYRRALLRGDYTIGCWGILGWLRRYSRDEKMMSIPLVWVDFGGRTDPNNFQSTLSLAETIRCYATAALYHLQMEEGGYEFSNMKDWLQRDSGVEVKPKVKADNLVQAIEKSDLSATLYFLGREPLDEPSKTSAFINVCQLGWYMVVDVLVELGAGEEQEDKDRLFYASEVGDINMARLLIGKRDMRRQDNNKDHDFRCMVVREVAEQGHAIIFKDMIQTWKSRSIFDDDQKGMTPLSLAIISGHHHIINLLLSNRLVNPNDYSTELPALHLAIAEGKQDMVELLLKFDQVDPNHHEGNIIGFPPLICAVRVQNESIFEKILNMQRTYADYCGQMRRSALWWAAALGLDSYVQKLLSSGKVDVDLRDDNGDTPLSIAVQAGHRRVVDLLLKIPETTVNLKAVLIAGKKGYQDIVQKVRPRIVKSERALFDNDERIIWRNVEENISLDELNRGGKEIDWDRLEIDERYISEELDYASWLANEPFDVISGYEPTNRNLPENQGHTSFTGKALDEEETNV